MRLTEPPMRLAQTRPQIAWTPAVQQVMDKALQRDAALRYSSANEFGRALSAAVQGLSTATPAAAATVIAESDVRVPPTRVSEGPGARGSADSGARARWGRWVAAGAVAVIAISALVYAVTRGGSDADATTTAGPTAAPPVTGEPVAATSGPTGAGAPDLSPARPGERSSRGERRPAGGVTASSDGQSYGDELRTLEESIADSASAVAAIRRVSILKGRVTLASDVAAVQFVEAKATLLTSGAAKGCALMRRIKPENLGAGWREQFTEGLQTCEGN